MLNNSVRNCYACERCVVATVTNVMRFSLPPLITCVLLPFSLPYPPLANDYMFNVNILKWLQINNHQPVYIYSYLNVPTPTTDFHILQFSLFNTEWYDWYIRNSNVYFKLNISSLTFLSWEMNRILIWNIICKDLVLIFLIHYA